MPDDKSKISADDINLFRDSVKGTRQLKQDKVRHKKGQPAPRPRQTQKDEQQVLVDMMSDEYVIDEVETGEELLFSRQGLQHKTLKRLRRGDFSVTAELDLHGKTVEQARHALAIFLRECMIRGDRCVRIIHGKGHGSLQKKPVLKNKVNGWLQQRQEILAFCSARPVDGGTGAVYVLLSRRQGKNYPVL